MSYGREFLKNVLVYCYPYGLDQKSILNSLSRIFVSKSFNNRNAQYFFHCQMTSSSPILLNYICSYV